MQNTPAMYADDKNEQAPNIGCSDAASERTTYAAFLRMAARFQERIHAKPGIQKWHAKTLRVLKTLRKNLASVE